MISVGKDFMNDVKLSRGSSLFDPTFLKLSRILNHW